MWSLNSNSILALDCKQRAARGEGSRKWKFASSNGSPRIMGLAPRGCTAVYRKSDYLPATAADSEIAYGFTILNLKLLLMFKNTNDVCCTQIAVLKFLSFPAIGSLMYNNNNNNNNKKNREINFLNFHSAKN